MAREVIFGEITSDPHNNNYKELYEKYYQVSGNLKRLDPVQSFSDLATTYPEPEVGDAAYVINDKIIYRWDGDKWEDLLDFTIVDDVIDDTNIAKDNAIIATENAKLATNNANIAAANANAATNETKNATQDAITATNDIRELENTIESNEATRQLNEDVRETNEQARIARMEELKNIEVVDVHDKIKEIRRDIDVAEAVESSSYDSVIPVPDSAINGQVSGVVRGLTYANLLGSDGSGRTLNNINAIRGTRTQESDYVKFTPTDIQGVDSRLQIMNNFKANRTYFVAFDYILNTKADDIKLLMFDELTQDASNRTSIQNAKNWTKTGVILNTFENANRLSFQFLSGRSLEDVLKIKKIIVVDITGEENIPEDELLKKYKYINNIRSTVGSTRVKSAGKNLFDGSWELGAIDFSTGENAKSTTAIRTGYIRVQPRTNYIAVDLDQISNNARNLQFIFFYDEHKRFIDSMSLTKNLITFTTPSNCKYIRFRSQSEGVQGYVLGDYCNFHTQLERGNTATEYEPYIEDRAYVTAVKDGKIVNLRSLPNGIKDEINIGERKVIIRTKEVVLNGGENWSIYKVHENTICFQLIIPDKVMGTDNHGYVIGFNYVNRGYDKDEEGYSFSSLTNRVYININKNKLMTNDINGFKEWLSENPVTLIYQLAEPEIIPVRWTGLQAYEGGTIYVDTVIPELGFYYNNGLESHYPDHPIKEVDTLYRVDKETGYKEPLDVSKCEIREDRLSFTHPDLVDGDLCDWDYVPMTESTRPETSLTFPSNLKASVNSLLDAENINKKEHNTFKARLDNHDRDIERIDADVASVQGEIDTNIKRIDTDIKNTNNTLKGVKSKSDNFITDISEKARITFIKTQIVKDADGNTLSRGYGDSILIELPNSKVILIDTHDSYNYQNTIDTLNDKNITTIDYFIISHFHSDHCGGVEPILETFEVDTLILPEPLNLDAPALKHAVDNQGLATFYNRAMTAINDYPPNNIVYPTEGQIINVCDEGRLVFYNTDHSYYYENTTNYNDFSLVCYFDYKGTKTFFSSDIEEVAIDRLMKAGAIDKVDIFKVHHHGHNRFKSYEFLKQLSPDISVVTSRDLEFIRLRTYDMKWLTANHSDCHITDGKDVEIEIQKQRYKVTKSHNYYFDAKLAADLMDVLNLPDSGVFETKDNHQTLDHVDDALETGIYIAWSDTQGRPSASPGTLLVYRNRNRVLQVFIENNPAAYNSRIYYRYRAGTSTQTFDFNEWAVIQSTAYTYDQNSGSLPIHSSLTDNGSYIWEDGTNVYGVINVLYTESTDGITNAMTIGNVTDVASKPPRWTIRFGGNFVKADYTPAYGQLRINTNGEIQFLAYTVDGTMDSCRRIYTTFVYPK